ncbi:MAG TPA: DUF63 family protein, partial [Thermoplasmata archaeon]|nr:DUF63 family protein [Thermoplasmata archaeon]
MKKVKVGPIHLLIFLFLVLLVLFFLVILFPEMFWERFIFKYYWGPVEADARDRDYQGVSEGYNPVNTLTYGVVVALSLYAIL